MSIPAGRNEYFWLGLDGRNGHFWLGLDRMNWYSKSWEEWTFLARFGRDELLDNPTIRVTDIPGISQTNLVIHPRTKESLQKNVDHAVPGVLAHPFQCQ